LLHQCLLFLERSEKVELEVILVDNGSTDGSKEVATAAWPHVKVLALPANMGFSYANNRGLEAAEGEAALLLNNDVLVEPLTIYALWQFASATPSAAATVPLLRNPDGTLQRSHYGWPSLTKGLLHVGGADSLVAPARRLVRSRDAGPERRGPRPVRVAKFACALITREAIDRVGLLDQDFFMYGEDADWCYRANRAGFKCFLVPEAEATHLTRPRVFATDHPMFVCQNLGLLLFHRKHAPPGRYRAFLRTSLAILRLRLAVARLLGARNAAPLAALIAEVERFMPRLSGGNEPMPPPNHLR
jgi:GT2 family glycosyltransferase